MPYTLSKCTIFLNKRDVGLRIIPNPNVEVDLISRADDPNPNIITMPDQEIHLYKGNNKLVGGLRDSSFTWELPPVTLEINSITNYPVIAENFKGVRAVNKTGTHIWEGDTINLTAIDNNADIGYHPKIYINGTEQMDIYVAPTRPQPPVPEHYSDIELNSINDYTLNITASSSEDVKVTNKLGYNILPRDTDGNNLSGLDDTAFAVYEQNTVFSQDHFKTYEAPTRPVPPTPDNYSNVKFVIGANGGIPTYCITIQSPEDIKIENDGNVALVGELASNNNSLSINKGESAVVTNDTYSFNVYTEDGEAFAGCFPYEAPTRPVPPTPDNYSYVEIYSLNDTIHFTATSEQDCKIVNKTGGDITVAGSTLANDSNIVITDNQDATV